MAGARSVSQLVVAALLAIFALIATARLGFAAIEGSIDPPSAHSGDWVELTTAAARPDAYGSIAAAGPTPLWLARADLTNSELACDTRLGDLTWARGVGHARFQVPDVQPGTYWILATVQGGCWRFGSATGILTLTVLPVAGGVTPGLVAAVVGMAVIVIGALKLLRRRALRSRDTYQP